MYQCTLCGAERESILFMRAHLEMRHTIHGDHQQLQYMRNLNKKADPTVDAVTAIATLAIDTLIDSATDSSSSSSSSSLSNDDFSSGRGDFGGGGASGDW